MSKPKNKAELESEVVSLYEAIENLNAQLVLKGPISETKPANVVVLTPMHATVSYSRKRPKEQYGSEEFSIHLPFELMTEWWAPEDKPKDVDRGAKELHKAITRAAAVAKIAVFSQLGIRWDFNDAGRVVEMADIPRYDKRAEEARKAKEVKDAPW